MTLTPEIVTVGLLCAANVGALIYNAATVNEKLKAVPELVKKVEDHGERLATIETRCETRHEAEVQI